MRKLWQDEAWEEYLYWQRQDKKTLKKINRLLTVSTGMDINAQESQNRSAEIWQDIGAFALTRKTGLCSE